VWMTLGNPADTGVGCTLTPLTVLGRRKRLWVESTRTRIESLSTTGTSIGTADANSTHMKLSAAASPASAAEPVRKSRRPSLRIMSSLLVLLRGTYSCYESPRWPELAE